MYINYTVNNGLSISKKPLANIRWVSDDIGDLVDCIMGDQEGSCPLDGAKFALLDGAFWKGSQATPDLLEEIYNLIVEYENSL